MSEIKVIIIDKVGLHARPASLLAKEASRYKSDISMIFGDKKANLKSIMNIMAMAIKTNSEIIIKAEGEDAELAISGIKQIMIESSLIEG